MAESALSVSLNCQPIMMASSNCGCTASIQNKYGNYTDSATLLPRMFAQRGIVTDCTYIRRLVLFLCLILIFEDSWAREPRIDRFTYPYGKSFQQVCLEDVMPHSIQSIKDVVTYGDLSFALWKRLPEARKTFARKWMFWKGVDEDSLRARFSGAAIDFLAGTVTYRSGKITRPPAGTSQDRLAIAIANFEHGVGLILEFVPLQYGVYFSPMSSTHLRAYSVWPDGTYDDKTYLDLDRAQRKIRSPLYYMALLDAGIKGDLALAARLSSYEQRILVDTLGIAIAECYQGFRVVWGGHSSMWQHLVRNDVRQVRHGPSFFNSFLGQLYNLGGWVIVEDESGRYKLERGELKHLYNDSNYHPPVRTLNEQMITQALLVAHPYEYAVLATRTGGRHLNNFFDFLAFLVQHPDKYDNHVRLALWNILQNWESNIPLMNRLMEVRVRETDMGT